MIKIEKYKIIHETKSWFFEEINNIGKPLAKLTKKEKTKSIKLEMKNEALIIIDNNEIQKLMVNTAFKLIFH